MFMYIVSDRFCVSTSFIYIYISKKAFFVFVQGLVPIAIQKKKSMFSHDLYVLHLCITAS